VQNILAKSILYKGLTHNGRQHDEGEDKKGIHYETSEIFENRKLRRRGEV
jgi:hypothetical protein